MKNIKDIINLYKTKIKEAGKVSISKEFYALNAKMNKEMSRLVNVEKEILEYFEQGVQTGIWENERYWATAAIIHPSKMYLECFFKIIETNDSSYPHWRILDVLAFMPEDLYPRIRNGIEKAIELNNPSWNEEDLKKAFEVLIWIGEKEDIKFIQQKCKSEDKKIKDVSNYWIEWMNEE